MDDTELREVAESLEVGDKVTLEPLDFEFTVNDYIKDPNLNCLNVFGEKDHYPEQGLFTKVSFVVDGPENRNEIAVDVYEEKDFKSQIKEKQYETLESISVVE